MTRASASVPWPVPPSTLPSISPTDPVTLQSAAHAVVRAAMDVLTKKLKGSSFCLTLINVGVTNFKPVGVSSSCMMGPGQASIARFVNGGRNPTTVQGAVAASQASTQRAGLPSTQQQQPAANVHADNRLNIQRAVTDGCSDMYDEEYTVHDAFHQDDEHGNMAYDCSDEEYQGWSEQTRMQVNSPGAAHRNIGVHSDVYDGVIGGPSASAHLADTLMATRRDYGSSPTAMLMPKSMERQMREAGQSVPAQQPRAVSTLRSTSPFGNYSNEIAAAVFSQQRDAQQLPMAVPGHVHVNSTTQQGQTQLSHHNTKSSHGRKEGQSHHIQGHSALMVPKCSHMDGHTPNYHVDDDEEGFWDMTITMDVEYNLTNDFGVRNLQVSQPSLDQTAMRIVQDAAGIRKSSGQAHTTSQDASYQQTHQDGSYEYAGNGTAVDMAQRVVLHADVDCFYCQVGDSDMAPGHIITCG